MTLSFLQIFRLGLVQMALGAIVVLTTSTLNRLMVVEFALPAALPGMLVGLHYGVQLSRPHWGFTSDTGGKRTRWIIGGMGLLALGGIGAALGVTLFAQSYQLALLLSLLAYALIGVGVGASGTSLLALLATATAPHQRAAAAMITWLMMIFGIALTAGLAGSFLDPYSASRLMMVVSVICVAAFVVTILAMGRIERGLRLKAEPASMSFIDGMRDVWRETRTRHFTIFVFLSMNAYF
ncbi:MAG: PucC family protein, partial [Lentibacter algarum]